MEQLIEELVDLASRPSPARIEEVQREIQRLQREPDGWQRGLALLKKDSPHFRFYGALTLTVKIRTDRDLLEKQDEVRATVQAELIDSYANLTNQGEQPYVLRKVCSTLAAMFFHPSSSWQFPVRHVLAFLCTGQSASQKDINDMHGVWNRIQQIQPSQLRSVLWLGSSLVEEFAKADVKGVESTELISKLVNNAPDVWHLVYLTLRSLHMRNGSVDSTAPALLGYLSSSSNRELLELTKEALDTALTWMTFDWPLEPDDSINGIIGAAMKLIMQCFYTPELATSTIHCLTGIAQQAPKYLTKAGSEALNELLTSQQAESYVEQLLGGKYESETTQFVVFVASLLELHDMSSPDAFQDQSLRIILIILRNLLYMPGTPVIVDSVSQVVLDAFNQIAEGWGDWVGTDAADESIKPLVHEACMRYAAKIQYPAEESDYASHLWESDERAKFQDFRHDFQDLLLASYACVGPELIDNLAAYLETSDISSGWENLEAQLYCLGAFSDVVSSNTAELGGHVLRVLTSQKWDFLVQNVNTIPERARQGAINFISRYTFILQQNQQLLLPCINFLFASLYLPGSTTSASRAIYTLCHRQRIMLVEALPQFIDSISILTNIQPEERHRLYGAVAAIIQAIPTEEGKAAPLIRILNLISQSTKVPEAPSANSDESGVLSAIDLVQTLAAVGKGLRAPADDAIDLDAEPGIEEQDFWTSGSGKQVQETVQNVLDHVLATYPEEPLLIEATCDLLKSGYTELHPSPFKFHASYSASFLSHVIQPQSSRVGLIMNTASSFLASHASSPDAIRNEFLQISAAVTWHQQALLQSFSVDKIYTDHEFTHSSLEYFSSILPKYDYYFGDKGLSDAWQILFEFALLALENPDTLPRRSSAQFWAAIFDHSPTLQHDASRNLAECIQHYGPRFVTTLLRLLGGGAARSEVDSVCEPLKKLVARQGVVGAGLLRETAARESGGDEKVRRFVEQVIGLRGRRKTLEVARDFWVTSRGAAFAYTG